MTGHHVRQAAALLCTTALTTALVLTAANPEVAAAKKRVVKCGGVTATKVGTAKADRIVGTAKDDVIAGLEGNDVILGLGGNDRICGGSGNDRVFGGPGKDRLLGQAGRDRLVGGAGVDWLFGGLHDDVLFGQGGPDVLGGGRGSDRLDGGTGVDLCNQATGQGPMVRCELPRAVFAPPAPPAPVAPTPETLAIAYSDLVRDGQFGPGDVLISKLVDSNLDGRPSKGDTIVMDRYPGDFGPTLFGFWHERSHVVTLVDRAEPGDLIVKSAGGSHRWIEWTNREWYWEEGAKDRDSLIEDGRAGITINNIWMDAESPSRPFDLPEITDGDPTDQPFIDVELRY